MKTLYTRLGEANGDIVKCNVLTRQLPKQPQARGFEILQYFVAEISLSGRSR